MVRINFTQNSKRAIVTEKANEPLRVAIVDEEFPYPANSGKRLRTLNLIKRLAATHELTYVAHRNSKPDESQVAREYFHSLGIKTIEVDRTVPKKSGIGFYGRLAGNLFSPLPYSVSTHSSDAMKLALQKLEQDGDIQLWHCEWTPYAELFRGWKTRPLVVAAHNVESLIWQRYAETESNPVKRWYIRHQWKKFKRFETWAFDRAATTISVSEPDKNLAVKEFGATEVEVVENGVDMELYASDKPRKLESLIFLGSLDWRPNLDGLQHFIKTSFPEIVAKYPKVVFRIVGRNPANWLVELAQANPNIQLHANVPDVVEYLSVATAMVVPLRVGGGSRLKIIEAAANGLPVISTTVGAEGLDFESGGEHYFGVDRIEDLARPVLDVLGNIEASALMAKRAKRLARQKYDWSILAQRQAAVWENSFKYATSKESTVLSHKLEIEQGGEQTGGSANDEIIPPGTRVMHLTSSRFFGGPERQMLGLAQSLKGKVETVFASFSETNLNQTFLSEVSSHGFTAIDLQNDTPNLIAAKREVQEHLQTEKIDVLVCHGYKAGLIGWLAARKIGIPAIAVSRGWTAENWKVALYEKLDRVMLRRMKKVVCVSQAQADKVMASGVKKDRVRVIRNSIFTDRFATSDARFRQQLLGKFEHNTRSRIKHVVGAAGRLSPEKGFDVLIESAAKIIQQRDDVGFVLFGDGEERSRLKQQIETLQIQDRFVLAGFTDQLDQFMPHFNLFTQSSHTEGLPNVLLESLAAGVPVVATDVGGTKEVLIDGKHGKLVPPARPDKLANAMLEFLQPDVEKSQMVKSAQDWIAQQFTFDRQANAYESLFAQL